MRERKRLHSELRNEFEASYVRTEFSHTKSRSEAESFDMANIPDDLRYTENHEWVRIEGDLVRIGISDHAQSELTDVVYVELPSPGDNIDAKGEMAIVESVKSTSDVFSPISGEVVEANSELEDTPELVNEDCYGKGWLTVIRPTNMGDVEKLLSPDDYKKLL